MDSPCLKSDRLKINLLGEIVCFCLQFHFVVEILVTAVTERNRLMWCQDYFEALLGYPALFCERSTLS